LWDLLKIFIPIDGLNKITTEKGDFTLEGWKKGSLFYLIDTRGKGTPLVKHFKNIDTLVCDDMGTEIADFIAVNTHDLRVIFIHAKAFKTPKKISASAFQEVCAQATKNLENIHPYSLEKPKNLRSWNGPWNNEKRMVEKRIRSGEGDAIFIWEKIRDIIRNPTASREVWIILGSGFSLKAFENEIKKSNPAAEIVQIIYLLQSTWSAVSSCGGELRIFCSP